MFDHDEAAFYTLLLDTDEAIRPGSKPRTPGAMGLVFEDLRPYSLDLVAKALTAHRRDPDRGQWLPNSAHIEHQINIRRPVAWIGADEAWSRVPKLESEPGIMSNESAEALAVAMPFLMQQPPEQNAARMAFRACYERLVDKAKLERRGPAYFVSPGGTYEQQQAVIEEGQRMGLLPAPKAEPVFQLEAPPARTPGAKPDLKALLLTLKPKTILPPEASDYEQ